MSKKEEELTQGAAAAAGGLAEPEDSDFWTETVARARDVFSDVFGEDEETLAVQAVKAVEKKNAAATQEILSILEAWNIDPNNSDTRRLIAAAGDTPAEQLMYLSGPGSFETIQSFINLYPEASLVRVTPYSQALEENAFAATFPPQPLSEAEAQMVRRKGFIPTIDKTDYEYSDATGAIRYANGTIVTADNDIIYDPSREAPGSTQWLRKVQETWSPEEIRRQKDKMVAYGYLPKELAKGDEFTVEFRDALETYWYRSYVNGGKPIASAQAGGGQKLPPLIDYKDFQAQITNDMRDQLRRVLGTEATEDQVRAQTQYIMRTAADLQKMFRRKEYGSFASQALTEATERAIGSLETSPYAQDVLENTKLADSLRNAAYVTQRLLS